VALSVDDRMVDLIAEHIDVALRVAHLEDSTLVARKLCDNPRVLVASPAYLARRGTPQVPGDLLGHDCLLYSSGARVFDEWSFTKDGVVTPVRAPGKIQINDGMALVGAARGGRRCHGDRPPAGGA
jgi:DNA-binding transcriptional LysR family regulator